LSASFAQPATADSGIRLKLLNKRRLNGEAVFSSSFIAKLPAHATGIAPADRWDLGGTGL
jgi:hypothetical protein